MALGQKNVAVFHVVTAGQCWLSFGDELTALRAGDVVLLPHGAPHSLLSSPSQAPQEAQELLAHPRDVPGADAAFGGSGETTTLVCGHYERDAQHPLFDSLPELVRVSIRTDTFRAMTNLVVSEAASTEAGASIIVERLAEALLVETLRRYADEADAGFIAALADEAISGGLSAFHHDPGTEWTVERLARAGGVSRSVFAARFRERVGESPMQYVTRWRMQRAQEMLTTSQLSLSQIASQVGYESEFAFSKAFKRVFGVAPGAARRQARSG
jgi:AraC-like DNA-binding protein